MRSVRLVMLWTLLCAAPALAASSAGSLVVEPAAAEAPYLRVIAGARHALDVNAYLLTDTTIRQALLAAAERGVRVQVIVAGNPYRDAQALRAERAAFAGTGVALRTAPGRFEHPYTFDHAKYVVADPGYPDAAAILGSSNLSYAGLGGGDRDYDWVTGRSAVVAALAEVFRADWNGKMAGRAPRRTLVLSPGAEPALVSLLSSARHSIDIETEEFGDVPQVIEVLEAKLRMHIPVRIVVPSGISAYDLRQLSALSRAGAQIAKCTWPYVHAKLVVADDRAFIGSENFSSSSLNENREVGIVLTGAPAMHLRAVFESDFAAGRRWP